MKIGVIGIGAIGGTLAARWRANGHDVRVANSRGAEAARDFANEIGAEAADIYGAVQDADVVVLSIPFPAVATLPGDLFDGAADGAIVIDTGNYYPGMRDPRIPEIDAGMPESVWVAQRLGRLVFKAFNSVLAYTLAELGRPEGAPDRLAIPVAGNDPRAKRVVMGLVNEAGFDPVDGGSLEDSWRQEPSTPAYCCDFGSAETRQGLAAAVRGKARPLLETRWKEGFGKLMAGRPMHSDFIALNRSLDPL